MMKLLLVELVEDDANLAFIEKRTPKKAKNSKIEHLV